MKNFITNHKPTFLSIAFLILFGTSVSFATPTPYTLDPNCTPTDPDCRIMIQGDLLGTNLTVTGQSVSIAAPALVTPTINYSALQGYVDNGYVHNYRVYAYKNTPTGRVYSSTYATIPVISGSVDAPTSINQVIQNPNVGLYTANGASRNYRVYAFKNVTGGRVYSTSYATLSSDFVDNNDASTNNRFDLSWDPVPGADGYRVLVYIPSENIAYDKGRDTPSPSFRDEGIGSLTTLTVTNGVGVIDQGSSQLVYTVNISWDAVPGADGYRVLKSNENTVTSSGAYSGYGYGSNTNTLWQYTAGYDTTSTSLIDDACNAVCFDTTLADVSATSGYSNTAAINGLLTTQSGIRITAGKYINWGSTAGSAGYGFRDNAGTLEYKNSGGSWEAFSSGGVELHGGGGFVVGNGVVTYRSIFIGTDAGLNAFSAASANFIGDGAGRGATDADGSNFFGQDAGRDALSADASNFIGAYAGQNAAEANNSNFFGNSAGLNATNASQSNFFGTQAGSSATNAYNSNFLGSNAGSGATNAYNSNFFGPNAGYQATSASFSNFIGNAAGTSATNAAYSNLFGNGAGQNAANASYSNFFGQAAGFGATNASYSNLFGYRVGYDVTGGSNTIGSNNIIIGTNISLPNATANAINIGGVLFGTGTYSTTTGNPSITPVSGGRIGIGVVSPAYTLQVGNSSVSGIVARFQNSSGTCDINPTTSSLACSSDITLKKNITTLADNTPFILTTLPLAPQQSLLTRLSLLTPVSYNWNIESDTDQKHAGFIAQQVEQVFPDLVYTDATTNLKSINYGGFAPYIVRAIQEAGIAISTVIPEGLDNTAYGKIKEFLRGVAVEGKAIFDTVQTKRLCVDDVCVTRDEFKQMLDVSRGSQTSQNSGQATTEQNSDIVADTIETAPETEATTAAETPQNEPLSDSLE